jgi:hypothetical protein
MGTAATSARARAPRARIARWNLLILVTLWASRPDAAGAQGAEVVLPDRQGDFPTLERPGARGLIRQRHWLVVDPDPAGLACRDAAGRGSIALRPGAIVESEGGSQALRLVQGRPWLWVRVPPVAILRDNRLAERGTTARCWVRANRTYLAPILPEALQAP